MLIQDLFISKVFSQKYISDGFVTFPLLDGDQVAYLRQLYDASADQANVDQQFFTSIWSDNIEYRRFVDSKIKEFLTPLLLGHIRDIKPVFANFMIKNTGEGTSLIPHQDWSFVDEPLYDSATIWCPLVDVSKENGNLQVIPHSHLINNFVRARFSDKPFDHIGPEEIQSMLIDIPLKAGEALILNSRLIHASPCNYSNEQRVAASLVIAPKQAPLFHWVFDPNDKEKEIKKLEVSPDFFWQFSCYENPDSVPAIDYSHRNFEDLSLQEFHKIITT